MNKFDLVCIIEKSTPIHLKVFLKMLKVYIFLVAMITITATDSYGQNFVGASFPYTGTGGITTSVTTTGATSVFLIDYPWYGDDLCRSVGSTTRGNLLSIGEIGSAAVPGTITYNFSSNISSVQILVSAGDPATNGNPNDIYNFTISSGTPIVTLGGTCTSSFTTLVSGNTASIEYVGPVNHFVLVNITSATPFSSLTIGFSGANNGAAFWMEQTPLNAVGTSSCNAGSVAPVFGN